MHRKTRPFTLVALLAVALLACGDGSTDPPPFPSVSGTYDVELTFDDFPPSTIHGSGTLTFAQPDQSSGELTGSANVALVINGSVDDMTEVSHAFVTRDGTIHFRLGALTPPTTWRFEGTVPNGSATISGRHVLEGEGERYSGSWSATRQ